MTRPRLGIPAKSPPTRGSPTKPPGKLVFDVEACSTSCASHVPPDVAAPPADAEKIPFRSPGSAEAGERHGQPKRPQHRPRPLRLDDRRQDVRGLLVAAAPGHLRLTKVIAGWTDVTPADDRGGDPPRLDPLPPGLRRRAGQNQGTAGLRDHAAGDREKE